MKRILALILAFAMLAALSAQAEEAAPLSGTTLPEGITAAADLDGDGASERISWAMVPEDEYTAYLTLTVQPAGGEPIAFKTDIQSFGTVYILDLDGDGALEALLTGDAMSDDYITVCLHYSGGALHEIVETALERSPGARLCLTAVTLETLSAALTLCKTIDLEADVTQIAVNRVKLAGGLHLLAANNPVFLLALRRGGAV